MRRGARLPSVENMKTTRTTAPRLGDRAIVVGASMAGLCAARVLAARFGEVVLLDRDDLPQSPRPRTRVPQGGTPTCCSRPAQRSRGVVPRSGGRSGGRGRRRPRPVRGLRLVPERRPTAATGEPAAWSRDVAPAPGIHRSGPRAPAATGHHRARAHRRWPQLAESGDRIIGCGSRAVPDGPRPGRRRHRPPGPEPGLAGELGFDPPPATSVVDVDTTYVTRRSGGTETRATGRRQRSSAIPDTRLTMALPMEDDQWIVLIGGLNGEAAPPDEVGLLAYARIVRTPP